MMNTHKLLAALAFASTFGALTPLRAQTTNAPAAAPVSKLVAAVETKLPVAAKSGLPRGARTIFAFKVQLQGRPVLLHGWRAAKKSDITLDILATTTAPARLKSRSKTRRKVATTTRVTRLNRVSLGSMESGEDAPQVSIEAAPLTAKRGSVLVFEWPYSNVSFSYSYSPLLLVTLPDGLNGRAVVQEFRGQSEPEGGYSYQGSIGPDGNFLLSKNNYSSDAGTTTYTPYTWNGKAYVEGKTGETMNDTHN